MACGGFRSEIDERTVDVHVTASALKFFDWAYAKGDKMAEDLDYVPLPDAVVDQIKATWASQIKTPDGKPVYTAAK